MRAWLFVGAKVVCVNADPFCFGYKGKGWLAGEEIAEGRVYTVSDLAESGRGDLLIQLQEVRRVKRWGYGHERFRPVSTIDATPQVEALRRLVERPKVRA